LRAQVQKLLVIDFSLMFIGIGYTVLGDFLEIGSVWNKWSWTFIKIVVGHVIILVG
jgi:hypothetical protein